MRVLILGGDGYLGWPQAMYLSKMGHDVFLLDSLARRHFDLIHDFNSLVPILSLAKRIKLWQAESGRTLQFRIGSTLDFPLLVEVFRRYQPEAVVHFAEHKSAPFSMLDREHACETMSNNVNGTLNVLYAIREHAPQCHLIKLGTMGEYGTPNIDIEEGYLEIAHNGRKDTFLYPKNPNSFYHLSKVHDSNNIKKCCDWWGIRATDLNQGIVYGVETGESTHPGLRTRFDYDQVYGTALHRFCVQAAVGHPLVVHGKGGQTRGFLNINDALRCIELALDHPPVAGEYRVFNQFTELFAVQNLANTTAKVALAMGLDPRITHIGNPRIESEGHYYNAKNSRLRELGLKPTALSDDLIASLIELAITHKGAIDQDLINPTIKWAETRNSMGLF